MPTPENISPTPRRRVESPPRFKSLGEARLLVSRFEDCTLPQPHWDHKAHLAVALWYMFHCEESEATAKMISGIHRYNHSKGIKSTARGGYHETLTLFWLAATSRFLESLPDNLDFGSCLNCFLDRFGERRQLALEFYSHKRLFSSKARQRWVEPDLKPLRHLSDLGA